MNRYETHLTLANGDPAALAAGCEWAEARALKWTQIVLDAGVTSLPQKVTMG